MGAEISPTSRCGQYYFFAAELSDEKLKILNETFPNRDVEEWYFPNLETDFHYTAIMTQTAVQSLIVLCMMTCLMYGTYEYGFKQGRFSQSYFVGGFYFFSMTVFITAMVFNVCIYIGATAIKQET